MREIPISRPIFVKREVAIRRVNLSAWDDVYARNDKLPAACRP